MAFLLLLAVSSLLSGSMNSENTEDTKLTFKGDGTFRILQ